MEEKSDILLRQMFDEAAQQHIADDGFTERVMMSLPETGKSRVRTLSRLWTLFCIVVGVVLFWMFSGWTVVEGLLSGVKQLVINTIEVFLITAPTTEIRVNPEVVLLLMVFVLVFLPYQTFRKLSATL